MNRLAMCCWVVVAATAYRPANVFLAERASASDVHHSIVRIRKSVDASTTAVIRRGDVVRSDADSIVFDAIAGSRQGRVARSEAIRVLDAWAGDDRSREIGRFERSLRMAQASVLLSQLLYCACQCAGLLVLVRIASDTVAAQ